MIYIILFSISALVIVLALIAAKQNKEEEKQKQDAELNELLDQIDHAIKTNNQEIAIWKQLYAQNQDLGEPVALFNGHQLSRVDKAPWRCAPMMYDRSFITELPTHEQRVKKALAYLASIEPYRVHDICNSAIFFDEAKVVILNLTIYSPKNITGMRRKMNREDGTVTFTIMVDNLTDPTEEITLPAEQADLFSGTMSAFRKMK